MQGRAVIIGGSVAGLAAAVALAARRGWEADVIERDVAPDTDVGDEAFARWKRPGVPQFQQPHAFSGHSRTLLLEHIPEVVDRLRDDGIEELNLFKALAPPELWEEGDDAFTGLWSRRPGFELAIRRVAEREPGVTLHCPAAAAGLLYDAGATGPPRVTGVRLDGGVELRGDVVLDCAGRRSPVPGWLAADHGVQLPVEEQDCKAAYYTRHYRLLPSSPMSPMWLFGGGVVLDRLAMLPWAGDHGTFCIGCFADPADKELRVLRHNWAFEAAVGSIPTLAPWIAPDNATPIDDTASMAGHQNMRRHFVVDGRPLALGVLPVGDSLCTTNPQYGWGATMALIYAFAAVAAVDEHAPHGALEELARQYDAAVGDDADGVYSESAAMDRMRIYEWDGVEPPEWDREAIERQRLVRGIVAGAFKDPVLGRAMLRRTNLVDGPERSLDDPEVVEHAKRTNEILATKAPRKLGPTRDELVEILAAAAPVT